MIQFQEHNPIDNRMEGLYFMGPIQLLLGV